MQVVVDDANELLTAANLRRERITRKAATPSRVVVGDIAHSVSKIPNMGEKPICTAVVEM